MFVTKPKHDIREIRQGDADFMIDDGMVQYPRAMLHVLPECPSDVRSKIMWAVNNGYLKCVSHVYGKELTMDAMRK